MNDERKCRDRKLHKKRQVSKDKTYARLLAIKDARQVSKDKTYTRLLAIKDANHDKIITNLCQDHTAQLRKSDANAKVIGGFLSHDNCATANKTGNNLMEKILELGHQAGMSGPELILYQGHCFHHLRNTWFEAIENHLSRKITDYL